MVLNSSKGDAKDERKDEKDKVNNEREKEKKRQEKKEEENYLNRIRDLIKEDQKMKSERQEAEGAEIEKTVNLREQTIAPLSGMPQPRIYQPASEEELTLKIVCDKEKIIVTVNKNATAQELADTIRRKIALKNFKMYTPTKGEIKPTEYKQSLCALGILNMDVIRVFKM